jgi:hypothetical protein
LRPEGSVTLAESPRCSPWEHRPRGLGTRFLLAEEMPIHEDYRRRLMAAAETDPQWYPNLYDVGWPDSPTGRSATQRPRHGKPQAAPQTTSGQDEAM